MAPVRAAWAAWGLAVSAYFVAVFHRTSLGVASLEAERRFHTGPSVLATFVAAQLAVYAGLQIPTGAMADRFGPRRMLTAALGVPGRRVRRSSDGARASPPRWRAGPWWASATASRS